MLANMDRMTEAELETFMTEGPITGWGVYENYDATEINVIPENDIKVHLYGSLCKCRPAKTRSDDGRALFVHNSFDGREPYENGKKPH
jgi:hypothetical protein